LENKLNVYFRLYFCSNSIVLGDVMRTKANQVQEYMNVEEKVQKTNINKLINKVKREEKKEKRNITIIFVTFITALTVSGLIVSS